MTSDHPDRRRVPRTATNCEATVVSQGGTARRPATVRNASAEGALVEVPNSEKLAGEVYLLITSHQMQPCKPVWRDGDLVGVSYPDVTR
jgi:hypothetical protein